MGNKMTLVEFKNYIKKEAEKLFKIAILKEEKEKLEFELSILKESTPPLELGVALMDPETLKKVRQEMLKKASGWAVPEPKQQLDEKKYSDKASKFIGKEIGHLEKDKNYKHDRAVAAAINVAKDKGYKIPAKNENQEKTQMYTFNVKHDNGTMKIKTSGTSVEAAKKKIADAEGAPESAVTLVKEESNL